MSITELNTTNTAPQTQQTRRVRHRRRPHYNVSEKDDAFDVSVSLPGVERKDVEVSVNGEYLNITAVRSEAETENWRPLRRELPKGDFGLNLRLNVPINGDKIEAVIANGILRLSLPKTDAVKTRKIEIN